MSRFKLLPNFMVLIAMSFALLSVAHAEDFTSVDNGEYVGYLRVGAGTTAGGGPQNCYYLGNQDGHGYRLGNECDSYAEIGYARTFAKADDGTRFVGHIMIADYSGNSAYSGNVGIAQIFVDAQGLDWLHGGTVWMGERYYERPDIHWMDLQYINLNGTGAGFDNIPTGWLNSKFSYAIFKDGDTDTFNVPDPTASAGAVETGSNSAVRNNLLLRGISTNSGGTLDIVLGLLSPSSPSNDRHTGWYANAFHKQDVFGGGNLFGVQYGVGSGTGRGAPLTFNAALPNQAFGSTGGIGPDNLCCNRIGQAGSTLLGSSDTRLRIFDAIWIQPTKRFSMAFDAVYQGDKSPVYGGGTSNWMSLGVRPEYAIFTHFKIQGEIGVDRMTYPGAASENLIKYTLAPTITLGEGFFDRPELRFFVTHANWNQAATAVINNNNNSINNSNGSLASITSNTSYGVQLEAWWGKNWF